jgi:hypothetical protein
MKITAMTDTSDLRGRLAEFAQIVGKETSEAVRQFARVACVNLATETQPFGSSKGDKDPGEKAVEVDVSKVFYTPQDGGFARALKAIVAKGNRSDASKQKFNARLDGYISSNNTEAIARLARAFNWQGVLFDDIDPQLHQNARAGTRRRVPKKRGAMHMVIGGNAALAKYKEEQKRKVGLTKAGWAVCAEKIPLQRASSATRGIPQWVTRNKGRASGNVLDGSHNPTNPKVQMTNMTPWTSVVLTQSSAKQALEIARDKFVKYMNAAIKGELRAQAKLKAAA